ncbi:hypothetical protein [Mesorhizobium amorphae]|uniref:Uncharacterized protein n=1 Tax=Mesorhizobium amorphae CCNWGS0123 TaxID=1082933 RepID=G6YET6_9HYPH|nr:hypothetical protein [Mesorhizobium amorphae]ANT52581.1 hypothetical protein A6B35_23165 [Mesorhizobium amorphae CCNWGS0123]EHH09746.1 hypothetical protein MEA186_22396 [Mesorhizobium amorphae CCNWGS0123]
MEVARYVGDAGPNGNRFRWLQTVPEAFAKPANSPGIDVSVRCTTSRKHRLIIPRQNGIEWKSPESRDFQSEIGSTDC